jgi:hypothetical protein
MCGRSWLSRALALLFCSAILSAVTLSADEPPVDLSRMTTAELASRAFQLSQALNQGLIAQSGDWGALKSENEASQADLQKARSELAGLKTELETRASESTESAQELSEARAALKAISSLVGSSATSWTNSIGAVEQALKEAAMKQQRAEIFAWGTGGAAVAASIWAIVEFALRKAGQ